MPKSARVTFVNVGYRSTNYWVVSAAKSRLLVDLGYPGTMGMMRDRLPVHASHAGGEDAAPPEALDLTPSSRHPCHAPGLTR
jgi:hypothetical protein